MERRERIILDTHIWLKLVTGDERILKKFKKSLERDCEKCISIFTIWEFSMLVSKRRFVIDEDPLEWINDGLNSSQVTVLPLSPEIAVLSSFLPGTFHGDPADRIIVASALAEKITLLTEDKEIIRYAKKGHLKLAAA